MNIGSSYSCILILIVCIVSSVVQAEQPVFSSLPDSPNVLYIDYDGELITDSEIWNNIDAPSSGLSNIEIKQSWALVAEAFKPFDVNVTTDRELYDSTPVTKRQMCIVTIASSTLVANRAANGVAKLGSFGTDVPCWSFKPYMPRVVSHEFGHTVGLLHDGVGDPVDHTPYDQEYYGGSNGWGPIMGNPVQSTNIVQWSKGEYNLSNNIRDDLERIAEYVGLVPDDMGDSISDATPVVLVDSPRRGYFAAVDGIVSGESDVDVYRIDVPAGGYQVSVDVRPYHNYGMIGALPLHITWLSESGQVLIEDQFDQRQSNFETLVRDSTEATTYYVSVSGLAIEEAGNTKYGSIGTYFLNVDLNPLYLESSVGEFSDSHTSPSELSFMNGENEVRGRISGGDQDYVTFTVPSGYLVSFIAVGQDSVTPASLSLAHRFGSTFESAGLAGGSDGVAQITDNMAEQYANFTDLGAGEHTFLIASHSAGNANEEYSLIFNLTPAAAEVTFDESIDGDLSPFEGYPTNLGVLDETLTIRGTIGQNGNPDSSGSIFSDADYFSVIVPPAYDLEADFQSPFPFLYLNQRESGNGFYSYSIQSSRSIDSIDDSTYEVNLSLTALADGWAGRDIGEVSAAGSMRVSADNGIELTGSGADIFGSSDELYFAFLPFSGDGDITARVKSLTQTHPWAKAGVMIRETLDADSVNAMTLVTGSEGVTSQSREVRGQETSYMKVNDSASWIRLTREGDIFTSSMSSDGVNWTSFQRWTLEMSEDVYIGLATTSHEDGVLTTAEFDNVSVDTGDAIPVGKTIWLKAHANGQYVCADKGLDEEAPLNANRSDPGSWETFTVVDAGDGLIALKANATGLFVSADKSRSSSVPLVANRPGVGLWEKFTWVDNEDGSVSLKASVNDKYVSADIKLDASAPLTANRSEVGPWEKFSWIEN
ncbi:MAG: hypothetical protein KTR16_10320 [Acidiferrobacterales bacterium]|nr:hypothetical protein [Acidiferrobacterales bacterium]